MPDPTENKPAQPVEAPKDASPLVQETAEAKAERESREADERRKAKEIADKAHADGDVEQAESGKKADEELPKKLEEADKGDKEKPNEKDKKAADTAKEEFEAQKLAAEKALKEAKDSGKPEDEIKKLQDALTAIEEQGKKLGTTEEKVEAKKGAFDGIKEAFKNLGEIIGKLMGFILGIEFGEKKEDEKAQTEEGEEDAKGEKAASSSEKQPENTVWEQVKELMKKFNIEDSGDYKKNFFSVMSAIGKKLEPETGVPWQVTAAQACLESGYGKHAPNFNLFGIKAEKGYKGPKANLDTTEEVDGKKVQIKDDFRVYSSIEESVADHARFLKENQRYKDAFATKDPKTFLVEIKKAGYATGSKYVDSAWGIVEKYS